MTVKMVVVVVAAMEAASKQCVTLGETIVTPAK
jgi:hypothetical protein